MNRITFKDLSEDDKTMLMETVKWLSMHPEEKSLDGDYAFLDDRVINLNSLLLCHQSPTEDKKTIKELDATMDFKDTAIQKLKARIADLESRLVNAEKIWYDCQKTVLAMKEYATADKLAKGLIYMKALYFKSLR